MAYPNIYETDTSKFPNYGAGILPSARGVFGALAGKTGNTMLSLMTTPEKYAESQTAAKNVSESMNAAAKAVPESIATASKPVSQILKDAAIATAAKQAVQAQPTAAPEPIATPETRATPSVDQGMNWAKAAQAAVKGFGKTPQGQGVQSMGDRGLVQDAQGRWVPGEALQAGIEANYQAGVAQRNPVQAAPTFSASEALDRELAKHNTPTTGMGALALLAGAKANIASEYEAAQNAQRTAERQHELGLRASDAALRRQEFGLKAAELPSMRSLREAQTKQTLAEAGLAAEKTRLYPETVSQSQKAAEAKSLGTTIGKLQDNILKLRQKRASAALPAEQEAYDRLISEQTLLLEKAMK